jgi:hypothetical protein
MAMKQVRPGAIPAVTICGTPSRFPISQSIDPCSVLAFAFYFGRFCSLDFECMRPRSPQGWALAIYKSIVCRYLQSNPFYCTRLAT